MAEDDLGASAGQAGAPGHAAELLSFEERQRLLGFHHLHTEESAQYVTIMRVLADDVGGLMSDWSAGELVDALADRAGLELDLDTAEARLRYLLDHGNLARSPREAHVRTIAEYQQARARYQVTPRGERIHRMVAEVLGDQGGTQEISSELMPPLVRGLERLAALDPGAIADLAPAELAEQIGTVFAQFDRLVESTRQFYAHLGELLQRVSVDRDLFLAYKGALLAYLQSFVEDVRRYAPRAAELLATLDPVLTSLCTRAGTGRGIESAGVRRSRGLEVSDWGGLRLWFVGGQGRVADAERIVDLSVEAIRALVGTINRLVVPAGGEISRHGDLLRLAGWFAQADDETAHALWAAAFGLYPPRHLAFASDLDVEARPTGSFWSAPAATIPVSLRERGDRSAPGRAGRRRDFAAAKARRLAERAASDRTRREAAVELGRFGPDERRRELGGSVVLSEPARALLLELHARAVAQPEFRAGGTSTVIDAQLGVRLTLSRTPGRATVVTSPSGRLTLHDLAPQVQLLDEVRGRHDDAEHCTDREDTA